MIPWGFALDDPVGEARLAVAWCRAFECDGWIVNAEDAYEGPANYWKTPAYLSEFRRLAPSAPLGLSYIGEGWPHRDFPIWDWEDEGAALLPQCYWANEATSIFRSRDAALRAGLSPTSLCYGLGTSAFTVPYPADRYVEELNAVDNERTKASFNVWLLDSTSDDYLRTLSQVRR